MTRSAADNPWLNLGINVLLPAFVLMKGRDLFGDVWKGDPDDLGMVVFVVAMAFPFLYGAYDLAIRRKWNFFSILGFIGVGLTGGIGLLKLPPEWIAVKEAAIPGVIGLVVLGSHLVRKPLVRLMLFRPEFLDVDRVKTLLRERGAESEFDGALARSNLLLAASFFLSSVLNYGLARYVVTSSPGTDAFNEELGRMTLLSYPVIVLPTMIVTMIALWLALSALEKLTGADMDDLLAGAAARRAAAEDDQA